MNKETAEALGKHFLAIGHIFMTLGDPPKLEATPEDPNRLRGTIEGEVKQGRLHDVQLPQKGGKSTKVFIVDESGGLTAYAGTFAFDPDDLMEFEGYDISYTVKEIEKGDNRFTALTSWQPLQ